MHKKPSAPFKTKVHKFKVPALVQQKMTTPQEEITFEFYDPTDMLVRLLALGPLSAHDENFAFFPEDSPLLHDFCHGARLRRMHDAMPEGSAVLSTVLFFDEINRDQKGYNSGDGAIIVGGFFRQRVRESTYAKCSMGTFPEVGFPKVNKHHAILQS